MRFGHGTRNRMGLGRHAAAGRRTATSTAAWAVAGVVLWAALALPTASSAPAPGADGAPPDTAASDLLRDVRIDARTSPDSLTVGDPVTLEIFVDVPEGWKARFPERAEAGGPVDLLDLQVVPPGGAGKRGKSASTPGRATWTARYRLAAFQVGDLVLAPWPVEIEDSGGRRAIAATDSIRFLVQSVLDDSLAQGKLRDLKGQAAVPGPLWPWILAGAVLVLLVLAIVLWLRRRRRPRAAVVPIERLRPPHELALEALRKLESERLPADGHFERHHIRLSEILRRYLEDGFGVAALEETTEEILMDLDRHGFDRTTLKQVAALCTESDLVKFAKHTPTIEECVRSLEKVREFVLSTAARSSLSHGMGAGAVAVAGVAAGSPGPAAGPAGVAGGSDAGRAASSGGESA